jgi:CO dehydrogenase/acetyl-CoA synthase alpha subunit
MAKGPAYYQRGAINVWDFIRDQGLNFHLGNAIKYICRSGFKDSKIHDLEKAIHYLENELTHEKELYFRASQGISYQVPSKELTGSIDEIVSEKSDC